MSILEGTDVDFLSVVVGRGEVESLNTTEVLKTLNKLTCLRSSDHFRNERS